MPKGFPIARALVIVAVVLVAIAYSAMATTWVTWVPTQTSAGTSATFNYWGGVSFMYSTQSVTWILPPMNALGTAIYDPIQSYLGSSGAALWIEFSSYSTSSSYLYQGTVTATATEAIGSSVTFSSSYQGFAAFAVIYVSSEKCGQLYFHADVKNTASSTGTFYGTYMFGNATWFYVTFYSASVASSSWFNPAVSGPNTCLSPGYYLYAATVYSTGVQNTVGTAQVSIGTTSEGTSTVPGTQYALNIAPASGDTMVFPWTTSASPYVKSFIQSVVNTAGSSTAGSFNVVVSGTTYSLSNVYQILYFYDSATNTFPTGGQVTPLNCPSNAYELPTTVSTSVTKLLSCQSLSSPSSGVAVYPGDYAKYTASTTSFIAYLANTGASTSIPFTFSYTDSAGNTYSLTTSAAVNATVYITSFSVSSPYGVYLNASSIVTNSGETYYVPAAPQNYIMLDAYIYTSIVTFPIYNVSFVNGAGSTGTFNIKMNGISVSANGFTWNQNNPPSTIVYFTGTDGYTYAFNPAWIQNFGITQALVGSSIYFVPTVIGETLTSTNLAFVSQGVWLNETTVNNSFMTYYPLPSFINFLSTPIMMYVNGTTSPRYLTPALAIINNNLQQYTVQYMNITAWSNVGSLMGVAIIQTPFSFIGFVSNGSLAPIWILLNSTMGVPPILFSYYPQIRYLLMPDTASVSYTLTTVYVNVPSQLFNQWSGNLVFGVAQAMQNGYYALVSGGFYAPPPTQFSLYVPTYLLNKLAQLFLASYPLSSTCTMLEVLSNPLETTICQGISQVVNINLGNTQVGKPAFGDVAGAFNITPLTTSLSLEQIIAINAATAALVILFIKKHQSLPAGLMLGGAIALALGIFFWLEMEIGIGILLFVAGAVLATTHRSQ